MKIEIISIGDDLLMSDVLDTNIAYVTRSLRENNLPITCKVTVGNNLDMLQNVLRHALTRADVVLAIHDAADKSTSLLRQAVAGFFPDAAGAAGVVGATVSHTAEISGKQVELPGIWVESLTGMIFCLPRDRQEMAIVLETAVIPYLRSRSPRAAKRKADWRLLRAVGIVESSARSLLADMPLLPDCRVAIDSFAGQTTIRLTAEGRSDGEVEAKLAAMERGVMARLGGHIFGEAEVRLEEAMAQMLLASGKKLVLAECHTSRFIARTLSSLPGSDDYLSVIPTDSSVELATYLGIAQPAADLTGWCRNATQRLLHTTNGDISLLVYKNITPGGMQILVTLASPSGVSVTQRSFGGHPENIDAWAFSLGMAHLRRWLRVNA